MKMDLSKEEITDIGKLPRKELINLAFQLKIKNKELENKLSNKTKTEGNPKPPKQLKKSREFDFSKHNYRHVLLKFSYLGWDRLGFAAQENTENTIEAELFKALITTKLIESRETSNYHRCGRTDKGVSAFSQVISITVRSCLTKEQIEGDTDVARCSETSADSQEMAVDAQDNIAEVSNCGASHDSIDKEFNYPLILNRVLPSEIRVWAWCPAEDGFSARFNCVQRTYKYFFPVSHLNLTAMHEAAQDLVGSHDFRNLCTMDIANGVVSYRRHIHSVVVECPEEETNNPHNIRDPSTTTEMTLENDDSKCEMGVVTIVGSAFLWHQIRAIMTVLLLVGEGKEERNIIQKLLDVENYPRKPRYGLASEVPLNLYSTSYDNVHWRYDEANLKSVMLSLQQHWAVHTIKSGMIHSILQDLTRILKLNFEGSIPPSEQYTFCMKDLKTKVYTPLLERPTCDSLEDKVKNILDRGRTDSKTLKVKQKWKELEDLKGVK